MRFIVLHNIRAEARGHGLFRGDVERAHVIAGLAFFMNYWIFQKSLTIGIKFIVNGTHPNFVVVVFQSKIMQRRGIVQ